MVFFGHIDQVICEITKAVSVAVMTDLIERCFGDHTVHIDPASFPVGEDGSACVP